MMKAPGRARPWRLGLAVALSALAAALAVAAWFGWQRGGDAVEGVDIGGPFTMTAQDGRVVTERDLIGHPSLVFFGFTYCPDVCPSTLAEVAAWLEALGPEGAGIVPYFVTVDPARDTPEALALYAAHFSPRIVALAGTPDRTRAMAERYRVYYKRVDLDGGEYLMDHTAAVYLMDDRGRFFDAITYRAAPEEALAKLRRLLAAS